MNTTVTEVEAPAKVTTETVLRPRFEGTNICTWIGFKHVNYLVEEAVLDWLRQNGWPSRRLFEEAGVGVDLVGIKTRILHALHIDDEVRLTVKASSGENGVVAKVTAMVDRDGHEVKAVTSTVTVQLRAEDRHGDGASDVPGFLRPAVVPAIRSIVPVPAGVPADAVGELKTIGRGGISSEVDARLRSGDRPAVVWSWRIPYPYCHHTTRMQMSGFLRQMEEVVDLFLEERQASIRTLLDEQNWIPVVPNSSIELTGEALMEEQLITVFEVLHDFKGVTYTSAMTCYVVRGDELVPVATGEITHGYAVINDRRDWSLVDFDERLLTAVRG
jgi:acyl-CoA thioesterase FadM